MTDRLIAIVAMVGLTLFTGVLVVIVKEIDLALVIVICLAMGIYDFWSTLRAANNSDRRG